MNFPAVNPVPLIDHTLLKPNATGKQIRNLCEEAVEFGFAGVCVPPVYVPLVAGLLYCSQVAVGTVIGFPLGHVPTEVKTFETARMVEVGATELDMVIHPGAALEGRLKAIEMEIRQVVEAARGAVVKVIVECCLLPSSLLEDLVECVVAGGAAYVKTSTGFAAGGASVDDVRLLAHAARGRIGVKAAGGIGSLAEAVAMIEAGAGRIGTSAGVEIFQQWRSQRNP